MRADLPPGLQIAQVSHASFEFGHQHTDTTGYWLAGSNYLVVVAAADEQALEHLAAEAVRRGIPITAVREPDISDELTAVAFAPGDEARRLLSSLPLALRERVPL